MTISRKISAATATAVVVIAGSGVAAAAEAPVVGKQHTSTARIAPATIPGAGNQKGEKLPSGARLVYRDVTLRGRQTATLTLRAPAGKTIRALMPKEGGDVGFLVTTRGDYSGRREVALRAYKNPQAGGEVSDRIYGLAR